MTGGYCNVNSETLDIGNEPARLTIFFDRTGPLCKSYSLRNNSKSCVHSLLRIWLSFRPIR